MASEDYLPLADHYGMFERRRQQLRLPEGGVLFRQGDAADSIYLVLEGELAVTTELDGKPTLLNYLHRGALIGEAALHEEALRGATVTASTDSVLLRFRPDALKLAFSAYPDLNLQFGKEALLRRRMAVLSATPLFARLPMDLRFLVARRSWHASYRQGDVIKPSGEYLGHVALISAGVVRLHEGGSEGIYCGRLKAGAMLGMQRLMHHETRAIALVAETRCETECMPFRVIEDVMDLSPWFRCRVREMGHRLSDQLARTIMLQRPG